MSNVNNVLNYVGSNSLSLFHCNIRSLPKNLTLLNDLIYTLDSKADVLACTETRLNNDTTVNISLPGYKFYHTNSPTAAGGTGVYVSYNLKSIPRHDIKFNIDLAESCWIEIDPGLKSKKHIISCVYRHPKSNIKNFTEYFEEFLGYINQRKYDVYILGDFNIDFFKYASHQPTEKYLDMLYSNDMIPVITKPTRITNHTKTLIDHIYTNTSISQILSGIALSDISDHLPVFCVINTPIKRNRNIKYFRDYKNFNRESYLNDLRQIVWNATIDGSELGLYNENVINTIGEITNRHAPVKVRSRSNIKLAMKPWITSGILKSIKTKQRMYYTHFQSNDEAKIIQYKKNSNKLNKIKTDSKNRHFNREFEMCKNNLKATWELIGELIKRKTKIRQYPTRIIRNNKSFIYISDQLNEHFVNVGLKLAESIKSTNINPTDYIQNSPSSSFSISPFTESEVYYQFVNLDCKNHLLVFLIT